MDKNPGSEATATAAKMMDTMFEVVPPDTLVVTIDLAKSVSAELVFEKELTRDERPYHWLEELVTAPDIAIPITLNPDSLPHALLTKIDNPLLSLPNEILISLRVVNKRNVNVKLKQLDFLKNVFGDDGALTLRLSHDGVLKNWQTEEMQVLNSSNDAEAWVRIPEDIDDLITQFGRRKRYKTAHGEVSALTGCFTIQASWTIKPRPKPIELSDKLDRHQKFISAKSFDHTIELVSSDCKIFKVSKAVIAAFSEKVEKQLQFLLNEKDDARTSYKALTILSGAKLEDGSYHSLNDKGVRALVRFVTMNSISEPLRNPALALELMMTASYNLITDLEKAMALVLLAQPLELFDVETCVYLLWFSSLKFGMHVENEALKTFWDKLRVRAIWNLKGVPRNEVNENETIKELFPDQADLDRFLSSI